MPYRLIFLLLLIALTHTQTTGFIGRDGINFVLNGKPFRFAGTNNYYVTYKLQNTTDDLLTTAATMGLKVVRVWAFLDIGNQDGSDSVDGKGKKDGIYFHYWDGTKPTYNDGKDGLQKLDYVLAKANQLGLRLILTLTNYWKDFGGIPQYVKWRSMQDAEFNLTDENTFYTDDTMKQWYKAYVNHIVNRVNFYTKVVYKDDPTIFSWELCNEPRCIGNECATGMYKQPIAVILPPWIEEMSTYIKSLGVRQMVDAGDEGFFCFGHDKCPTWSTTCDCYNGVDTLVFTNISTIDFMSLHLYPNQWGGMGETFGEEWIINHTNYAHSLGKPVVMAEYGLRGSKDQQAVAYKKWTDLVYSSGMNGDMFWMLVAHDNDGHIVPDYDGYAQHCPSDACTLFTEHANQMSAS